MLHYDIILNILFKRTHPIILPMIRDLKYIHASPYNHVVHIYNILIILGLHNTNIS